MLCKFSLISCLAEHRLFKTHRCDEFARQGCKVYATSRNVGTIGEFQHDTVEKLALDVTSDEDVQRAVEHVVEVEGKIDIVVNNAGLFYAGEITRASASLGHAVDDGTGALIDQSIDKVKNIFDTNTFGVLRLAKVAIPHMAKRRSGLIVNIGSVVADRLVDCFLWTLQVLMDVSVSATPWNGLYCATKAAMQSISDVLSMECRPFNISVLHVAPAAVKSNISANGAAQFRLPDESLYSAFLPNILKRIHMSQSMGAMETDEFARQVVSTALRRKPPLYLYAGGKSWLFQLFRWLPKPWVLSFIWKEYSQKIKG